MIRFIQKDYTDAQEMLEPGAIAAGGIGASVLGYGSYLKDQAKKQAKKVVNDSISGRALRDKLHKDAIKERVREKLANSKKYAKGKKLSKFGYAGLGVGAGLMAANEMLLNKKD